MARVTAPPGYVDFVPVQRFQPWLALDLSPDGSTVAYSSNADGQFNLWIQPVAGGPARQLTSYTRNAVRDIAWAPDGQSLLFTADRDGDEQYHLYTVGVDGTGLTRLTTTDGCQRDLARAPYDSTGSYLVYAVNDRDPAAQDAVVQEVNGGGLRRFVPPAGHMFEVVGISPDGRWLLAGGWRAQTDIGCYLADLTDPDGQIRKVSGGGVCEPVAWSPDSAGFYLLTDMWGGEFTSLGYFSLADGVIRAVAQADWDVELVAVAAKCDVLVWTVNEGGRSVLHVRRDGQESFLPLPKAVISAVQVSPDGAYAVLQIDAATRPMEIAVVDLMDGTLRSLTDTRPPALRVVDPVEPVTVSFPSQDGRQVPALQYRPRGNGPFAVLLWLHGGPHDQERQGYGRLGLFQFLLQHGVAVLCPQAAGSAGYGLSWQRLIYRDWGGVDLEDFDAVMRYLRSLDWVYPQKVAVAGPSYGGFAALSCLSRLDYPWACGVSICGPSNLITLATQCPPTWRGMVDTVLGNPERDADYLRERSPIAYAHQITAPLYVIQGAQDPRVPRSESDQIVEKVRANGTEVHYDVYPDEGHGFTSRTNEIAAYMDIADFLLGQLI